MDGYLCENCYGSFIDPICEECQLKELEAWLIDNGYTKINRSIILRVVKKNILMMDNNFHETGKELCVVCNRPQIFSCPLCFDHISLETLKKFHAEKKEIDNFLKTFNHFSGTGEILLVKKSRR